MTCGTVCHVDAACDAWLDCCRSVQQVQYEFAVGDRVEGRFFVPEQQQYCPSDRIVHLSADLTDQVATAILTGTLQV